MNVIETAIPGVLIVELEFFGDARDELYSPSDEKILRWIDPELAIDWGNPAPTISAHDLAGQTLARFEGLLPRYESA